MKRGTDEYRAYMREYMRAWRNRQPEIWHRGQAQYMREYYRDRKSSGQCVSCGADMTTTKVRCADCNAKQRALKLDTGAPRGC